MSKRRQVGEWVWLKPCSGFVGESHKLKVEVLQNGDEVEPCLLSCGDKECREWDVRTERDGHGMRHVLFHVSECQMLDEPWHEDPPCGTSS